MPCTFLLRRCILCEGSFWEAEKGKLYQVKVCQFTRLLLPAASCLLTLCHHAIIADVTLPEMVLPRSPLPHYSISSSRTNFPAHPIFSRSGLGVIGRPSFSLPRCVVSPYYIILLCLEWGVSLTSGTFVVIIHAITALTDLVWFGWGMKSIEELEIMLQYVCLSHVIFSE